MEKFYSIALDGPGGAGKSTIARALAQRLGFRYVDTGAIYRTVGYEIRKRNISSEDYKAIAGALPQISLRLTYDASGSQHMLLNGKDVTAEIRMPEVSMLASKVSAIPAVRDFLLQMQRETAEQNHVVMDGRDIGTVVLPNADVKIFLTAPLEIRARRRWLELREKGREMPYEQILQELRQRDEQDSSRATAPLRRAHDAVLLDTGSMNLEQAVTAALEIVQGRIGKCL